MSYEEEISETPSINGVGRLLGSEDKATPEERAALIDEIQLREGLLLVERAEKKESSIWTPDAGEHDNQGIMPDEKLRVLKTGPGAYNPYTGTRMPMGFRAGMLIFAFGLKALRADFLRRADLYIVDSNDVMMTAKTPKPAIEPVD